MLFELGYSIYRFSGFCDVSFIFKKDLKIVFLYNYFTTNFTVKTLGDLGQPRSHRALIVKSPETHESGLGKMKGGQLSCLSGVAFMRVSGLDPCYYNVL